MAIGVALEIAVAVVVVGVLVVGMVRLIVRHDLDATEEWKRLAPFILLGCGVFVIVAGWYGSSGVASTLQIIAGAVMAGNGAYVAVRNRWRRRPPADAKPSVGE